MQRVSPNFRWLNSSFCPSRGPRATWGAILDNKFLEIPRSQMTIFHELDILMHFDIFLSSGIQAQPKPSRLFPGFHGLQIVVVSARHGTSWTPVNPSDLQAEVEVCYSGGTPKSSTLIGFSSINQYKPFYLGIFHYKPSISWGSPSYGTPQVVSRQRSSKQAADHFSDPPWTELLACPGID